MKTMKKSFLSLVSVLMLLALTPAALAVSSYTDVAENAWYAEAVAYVSDHDLMVGKTDTAFAPNENADRATVVEALWRATGTPDAEEPAVFSDVVHDATFKPAVDWAVEYGLVTGYPDGTFGGNGSVTREQLVTMLWRYEGSPAAENATFSDSASIGGYASSAVGWAQTNDIVKGVGQNRFDPQGTVTRAQLATVLMNYLSPDLPAYAEGPIAIVIAPPIKS